MIYMVELNIEFIPILKKMFGEISNIYNQNFLDFDKKHFNFIIGNPPFNFKGSIKVPTSNVCKKKDGKTIWQNFIKKAVSLLCLAMGNREDSTSMSPFEFLTFSANSVKSRLMPRLKHAKINKVLVRPA